MNFEDERGHILRHEHRSVIVQSFICSVFFGAFFSLQFGIDRFVFTRLHLYTLFETIIKMTTLRASMLSILMYVEKGLKYFVTQGQLNYDFNNVYRFVAER